MQKEGETDFDDKLIHASVANHYDSDGCHSLCATVQSIIIIAVVVFVVMVIFCQG
jgi:hypothetical protein